MTSRLTLTPRISFPKRASLAKPVSRIQSIRTRLMASTAVLIVAIVGAVMWQWARSERRLIHAERSQQSLAIASALARAWYGQLYDLNWSQLHISADLLLRDEPAFVYAFVTDRRQDHRIVAGVPRDLEQQFVPDVVRADVTTRARIAGPARMQETFLLRDVDHPAGHRRASRGERVLDVAADMRDSDGVWVGTLRVGVSLAEVDRAVRAAIRQVLLLGALGLLAGLAGAYFVARRLTDPLLELQASASQIAQGDLEQRVEVHRRDELGALASAFNSMREALSRSFERLRRTLASFERFVPRKFLSVIAREGIENIHVGTSVTREMTILFSDIRGYTTLSENTSPKDMFDFLNDYLPRMGEAISRHGGFIDKYIGDAVMALFDDEHADGAMLAAIEMRRALGEFNAQRRERGQPEIDTGIGVHRGSVVMGTIGFQSKIESTVIGDAVNVASRIEGLTKQYRVGVLVTTAVMDSLRDRDAFDVVLVDEHAAVKGKGDAVGVWELRGSKAP